MKYKDKRPHIPADIERQIKVEAGHKCSINKCSDRTIEVHHIDENRENNNPNNLIALCRNHHKQAHDGFISRQDLREYKRLLFITPSISERFGYNEHDKRLLNEISALFPFDLIGQIQNELFRKEVARYIIDPFGDLRYKSDDPLFSFNDNRLENLRIEAVQKANTFLRHFNNQCVGGRDGFFDYIDLTEEGYKIDVEYWKQYSLDTQSLAYDFCKIILLLRKELKYCL